MDRLSVVSSQLVPNHTADRVSDKPLRVLITGAAGQIAYSLIGMVASGETLGHQQKVILHLLDIAPMEEKLKGVAMEIEDCAYPLVQKVITTSKEEVAFKDVDIAMLVGAMPRQPGMERKDLLLKNAQIFKSQGKALDTYASKNVKVVVVGNPANTNCLIAQTYAPSIPKENFSALTRLDQNRAEMQVALKLNVHVCCIQNVVIWGNHSATQYPDVYHAMVNKFPSAQFVTPAVSAINDQQWIEKTFIPCVQQRGAAVLNARKSSSAMSAAKAISDHVHDWIIGTAPGRFISMAVTTDGSYGIPAGLIFSFPVTCSNGRYSIVPGLNNNNFSKNYIEKTTKELLEEKQQAGL